MKKFLSVLLSVSMLFSIFTTFTVSSSAATVKGQEYLSAIEFVGGEDDDEAAQYIKNDGYTILKYKKYSKMGNKPVYFNYDLNDGHYGYYLYLGYKTTTDTSLAIRDMLVLSGNEWNNVNEWINPLNGCKYYAVGGRDEGVTVTSFNLNTDFEDEESMYLFVTYDAEAGNPVYNLSVQNDNKYALCGYDGRMADLNASSRHNYIYYEQTRYFSSFQLGAADDEDVAENNAYINNYRLIYPKMDLNENAGGDYIYMSYQLTGDASKAIRDIICLDGEYDGVTEFYNSENGCTYTAIKGYIEEDTKTLKTVDVNRRAGGDDLWLFYTTDPKAGDPITDISFYDNFFSDISDDEDDNAVKAPYGGAIDLNKNAGGDYIYMLCEHTPLSTTGSIFSEEVLPFVLISGGMLIFIGIAVVVTVKKESRR